MKMKARGAANSVLDSATKKVLLGILCIGLLCCLFACDSKKMADYYSERNNYVEAVGTVTDISYNAEAGALYLSFSDLEPAFDDICFKIVGENLVIVQNNGIEQKINVGDRVEFVSAPRYFGDGYVMPIVQISVDGEELLSFDTGFVNLNDWLKRK